MKGKDSVQGKTKHTQT